MKTALTAYQTRLNKLLAAKKRRLTMYKLSIQCIKHRLIMLTMATILVLSAPLNASNDKPNSKALPFEQLTPSQQQQLAPFKNKWSALDQQQRQKVIKGLSRWNTMNTQQKQLVKKRFKQWRTLPHTEKRQLRRTFHRYKSLSPAKRKQLKHTFQKFRALPADRRHEIKQRFLKVTPKKNLPKRNPSIK